MYVWDIIFPAYTKYVKEILGGQYILAYTRCLGKCLGQYIGAYTKYLRKKCLGHYILGIHQVSWRDLGDIIFECTTSIWGKEIRDIIFGHAPSTCLFGFFFVFWHYNTIFWHTPSTWWRNVWDTILAYTKYLRKIFWDTIFLAYSKYLGEKISGHYIGAYAKYLGVRNFRDVP